MKWKVLFHPDFDPEFAELPRDVRKALAATALVLQVRGPQTGRPHVDSLEGSEHGNMKELRFDAHDGVWRVAFAFDRKRQAILLCAGDKAGVGQKRFYRTLIATADRRFSSWLKEQEKP